MPQHKLIVRFDEGIDPLIALEVVGEAVGGVPPTRARPYHISFPDGDGRTLHVSWHRNLASQTFSVWRETEV